MNRHIAIQLTISSQLLKGKKKAELFGNKTKPFGYGNHAKDMHPSVQKAKYIATQSVIYAWQEYTKNPNDEE